MWLSQFLKTLSARSVFESFRSVHTKTPKRWKYDSIPNGACVILVVYDVRRYDIMVFENHRFRSSTRERWAILKSVVEKMRLQSPFHPIREDGRRNRRKKNKSVYKQNPNTRGRGLRKELMLSTIQNLFQLFICTKLKKLRLERLPTCPEKALKKA